MKMKCKVIFNIDIVNLLIIHVAIDKSSENHIEKCKWVLRKDWTWTFENDGTMFVMHIK
jgi:hypothetical protein